MLEKNALADGDGSSQLFNMPTAYTIGAYQLALRGDGSLLKEPGVLSFSGLAAIGVGGVGQLEYRHTSAFSVNGVSAPLPSAGVHIMLPLAKPWPQLGAAFRMGLPHSETKEGVALEERVSDLYLVASMALQGSLKHVEVHGALRISSAEIQIKDSDTNAKKTLLLPAVGWSIQMKKNARIIGEMEWAPRFSFAAGRVSIERSVIGRLGVDWKLHPYFKLIASTGYSFHQVPSFTTQGVELVNWDIRLGGEFQIPWRKPFCQRFEFLCS